MTDFGMKVSKAGFEVRSATPTQLSMSSKYDAMKVKTSVTTTLTINLGVGDVTHTIAHGVAGYVPAFACFAGKQSAGSYFALPWYDPGFFYFSQITDLECWIDGTNLSVRMQGFGAAAETINFKYYIFFNQLD